MNNRTERLLPNGHPKWIRCYDNGGESIDRYTVVFTGNYAGRNGCDYLAMDDQPTSPQGFGQHMNSREIIDRPQSAHLGRRIPFSALPDACRRLVLSDYRDTWGIRNES